jgi:uncharacterized membrane protein YbaN (DUF454 family)
MSSALRWIRENFHRAPKPIKIAGGLFLIALGITGLILPVMPGWIFLIPGLMVIGEFYPPAYRFVEWLKSKYHSAIGKEMRQ